MKKQRESKMNLHAALGMGLTAAMVPQGISAQQIDRTVLPIPQQTRPTYKELDARNVPIPENEMIKAPKGAPNVVLILLDDVGFSTADVFGGPIPTPTMARLASEGVSYTNFHTTALSSPTRAALKSGRNHHQCNMGFITEMATGFPGNTGQIPDACAPVAEMLRLNGYSTAAFGKWHETAAWEVSPSGPFDRWPTHQGFDKFYGFLGGETNQWAPYLYDGVTPVEIPEDPNYHFMKDMTDKTIEWMNFQNAMTPDKPFFVYFAPGATHAPHHVPQEWIDKWKGKFDKGWDAIREETFQRQLKNGVIPKGTKLAPKPEAIRDWKKLTPDEQRLFARQAEVYAAYLDYTDHEVGRMLKAIEDQGEKENTMVIYICGDNGASAEGGMNGMFNEYTYFNGVQETVPDMIKKIDKWGDPTTYPHMAAGWAVTFTTPFSWTKQVASDFGGTRNGMVVSWPKGITAKGEFRTQFSHVVDIAPTILEAANLPEPTTVNGTKQIPMAGVSLRYTFGDAKAADRHTTQYFEIAGNRAIYHEGWMARVIHRAPWETTPRSPLAEDKWELFNVADDFSLTKDLASKEPKKLKEMQDLFMKEAEKYNVLPIDDRTLERASAERVNRPSLMGGRTSMIVSQGMSGMTENAFIDTKNKSVTLTAQVETDKAGAQGTVIAQGGRFGGWSLYVDKGVPAYTYNYLGLKQFTVKADKPLPAGKSEIRFEFAYDGGIGKGGQGTFFINNTKAGEGRIELTQAGIFSADEGADVGIDLGTPVVESIGAEHVSKFTGKIPQVKVEVK